MRKKVEYGEQFKIVGNHKQLGNWDAGKALDLTWHEGDVWAASAELPIGVDIEFKCVRVKEGDTVWEDGNNRKFKAWGPDFSLDLRCTWGSTRKMDVHSQELKDEQPAFRDLSSLQSVDLEAAEADQKEQEKREQEERWRREAEQASSSSSYSTTTWSDSDDESSMHTSAWQGKQVTFMRSNQHSNERQGVWDLSKLPGPDSPLHNPLVSLVKGDEKAPNWLAKLGVVKKELVDEAVRARPDVPELAAGYVYMQWITTGAIPCVEGGGHYRPNHHARLAQEIFRSLEWVIEDDIEPGRAATLLCRKISQRLPSFGEAFTQQVPLTRIRDIAHRNDIPHDLKQEIKHTLQNKLHRNAGPEDLVAAEAMLARIYGGNYSGAFVNEFKIFVAELRDFFNAAGLTQLLENVRGGMGPEDQQVIDFFLRQKAELDSKGNPSMEDLTATCHALTTVRALLLGGLNSGLRNDAPDAALAMRQRWRLAEVKCEDYAFVLLSRCINKLEEEGGSSALLTAHDRAWSPALGALVLGLRQLGLGGWAPAEAMAIEHELAAWERAGGYQDRDNALRLKASLERLQRLTETYSEQLLELLPPVATALGAALGVASHAVTTFTEAEIRANVVFQVSKLTTVLLRACRTAAGCSSWDPLVAGCAVGKLVELEELDPQVLAGFNEPVVVLLRSASGDEEVAAAGANLKGVVLTQDLPHLSHLGVRARQEKMPFAMIDDPVLVNAGVRPLLGQTVALDITPDSVNLGPASSSQVSAAAAAASAGGSRAPGAGGSGGNGAGSVSKVSTPRLLQLLDCTPSLAGAKASACARLEQVSLESRGPESFKTPRGVCVPFGSMELALASRPAAEQQRFASLLAASEPAGLAQLEDIAEEMQALLSKLVLPEAVLGSIQKSFTPGSLLIARSSANVEDLAGMSGAGLYESVPNVPVDRPEDVSAAVAAVWSSLFTRRAILSRRAAGVAQKDASMAVLIQELLSPAYSFVLHTASPMGNDPSTAEFEVAAGLGETLASGKRGSAWRLAVNKSTGAVKTLAFANFSEAMLPAGAGAGSRSSSPSLEFAGAEARSGGLYSRAASVSQSGSRPGSPLASMSGSSGVSSSSNGSSGSLYECSTRVVDYSKQQLSVSTDARVALGRRVGSVAACMERAFGGAQDVEGCLVGEELYVVQTRPQP